MIHLSVIQEFSKQSTLFLLIITRFMATIATLSFFRRELVPIKITLVFSFVLTVFILMNGLVANSVASSMINNSFLNLSVQFFLGFICGFVINLFVDVFISLGQIISVQSGLGFVNLYIPKIGTITPLSQFFFITSAFIFFEINGHLVLIKMIVDSYQLDVFRFEHIDLSMLRDIMMYTKIIFSGSLMLSLSIIIALLVSNITVAIMTRFSPQLNVFSVGINISLVTCFFIAYLSFDAILENGRILLHDVLVFVGRL